jgi:hypothetical protein
MEVDKQKAIEVYSMEMYPEEVCMPSQRPA